MHESSSVPLLLTAQQVAVLLQIPVSTIYEYARRKHNPLPSIPVGRHRRFRREDLDRWLDDQREVAA